ncbi:MAG: hypothetical protein RMZ41_022020 [Nostoc sp. DedVER02]|uniref:hypothetical protein n=1 Tax=unclassified Nostoc TaxID=2593658 RepID=UPI002AD4F77B|nr:MULTISPECIES: hypothetical protein [unclassified Nostoc]MDZ7987470.1 hypothetical protein [Nostoc sp. DedVER02]MDZ8112593.1 hypothetical protein [Nostoc sp. DedVER01b]
MLFQFAPAIQAGIEAGKYLQVFSNGVPIGIARDAVTGQFVANAIGAVVNNSPLSPLVAAPNLVASGMQMYQTHQGFTSVLNGLQTIQTRLGVLQATTALIGVGTITGVALTAVNLHQTMKLRKEVEQMRLEVKNGFIDLKQALKDQGVEIRQIIEQVAQDIKFEQHRTALVRAYGVFIQAMNRFRSAMQLQDLSRRNAEIDDVRGMLFAALADYSNPHLLEETCAAGQLRRLECAWAIEQAIVATYQVQNEVSAVSDRLILLQDKICKDAHHVINRCESHDELDFLFPEIIHIKNHDLAVLNSWQNHVDWIRSLPSSELKLLSSADLNSSQLTTNADTHDSAINLGELPEQLLYESLAEKSHFYSLRDQLLFIFEPELRREYEFYISQQAGVNGYKTLVTSNLQQASDLTVANLYHYFNIRDKSEDELEVVSGN